MQRSDKQTKNWTHGILLLALLALTVSAGMNIYNAAGHGVFLGHFDKIWGAIFIAYLLFSVLFFLLLVVIARWPRRMVAAFWPVLRFRECWWVRWPLSVLIAFGPAWILLYTPYGFDLSQFAIRLYLFVVAIIFGALLLTSGKQRAILPSGVLQSIVVVGTVFLFAKYFVPVTDFPLSLTWSEGNRMWDYSVLFGRDLYIYPADKPLEAYIDKGRQSLWGLPFLFPGVTISQVRLWSALVFTVPYAILGWVLFRFPKAKSRAWVLAGLWGMLFLNQGPIYTPLVLAAILVALSRRWPLWIGLPMIFAAGYYAQMSRLTWMLAPAIWAVMMAINDTTLSLSKGELSSWGRVAAYGFAGFLGGFGVSGWRRLQSYLQHASKHVVPTGASTPDAVAVGTQNVAPSLQITDQVLLWSRLWPNPTYREGILLGLILAVGPLVVFLLFLLLTHRWSLNRWQKWGLGLPLLAFLSVGIVISVKIGGGSNLHNLDMFLIALLFVAAFAWTDGGLRVITQIDSASLWLQVVILLLVTIPSFYPMIDASPLKLPPEDRVVLTLQIIQNESDRAVAAGGEVLFMDQRQLLTFGFITGVPLVAEYEKKLVMDKAMSGDVEYFSDFYRDLETQRFALIITEPQNVHYATSDDDWAEENDVWIEWVTKPLLCYYEPVYTIRKTGVWILSPREHPCITP